MNLDKDILKGVKQAIGFSLFFIFFGAIFAVGD